MKSYYYIKCRDTGLIMISSEEPLCRTGIQRVIENYFGYGKIIESYEREAVWEADSSCPYCKNGKKMLKALDRYRFKKLFGVYVN